MRRITLNRLLLIVVVVIIIADLFSARKGYAQCGGKDSFALSSSPSCANQNLSFANYSTGGASSYDFKWGDGKSKLGVSSTASQTHKYTVANTYTVWMIRHFTSPSCTDSDSIVVVVNPITKPTVSFSYIPATAACSGTSITFKDLSTGNPISWVWDFGDGATSTLQNPAHTFFSSGSGSQTFNVKLSIVAYGGCSTNDTTIAIKVKQAPVPAFGDSLNVFSQFRTCISTLTKDTFIIGLQNQDAGDKAISGYSINWGDGSGIFTAGPSFHGQVHQYVGLGEYILKYTETDTNGCSATSDTTVVNESNPSVGVSDNGSTAGCLPISFYFKLNAKNVSPTTTFVWNFGDGTPTIAWNYTRAQDSIQHTYTKTSCGNNPPGGTCKSCYIVSVSAVNACDSTTGTVDDIKIYEKPKANFSHLPNKACANVSSVNFTNSTVSNCVSNSVYKWNFGDGSPTVTTTNPAHKYVNQGIYKVTLIASNPCGADTIIDSVEVDSVPVPNFTPSVGSCVPSVVNFTDASAGRNLRYFWTVSPTTGFVFTHGTSDTSRNPQITFTSAASYTVTETATNGCGSITKSQVILVPDKPYVKLNAIPNHCGADTITPSDSINSEGSPITAYSWTFNGGSPASSGSQNPGSITYSSIGSYTITVSATNACGTSKDSTAFKVNPFPLAKNAGNQTICAGTSVNIGASSVSGDSYSWASVPSGFSSTSSNPMVSPSSSRLYILTETITATGCQKTDTVSITVNALPIVVAGSNESVCIDKSAYNLTGYSPSGGTWSGTGVSASGTFTPATAGAGTVTLTYSFTDTITHCSNSATKKITVNALPVVNPGPNDTFCSISGNTVTLTGYSPSGGTWSGHGVSGSGVFSPSTAGTGSDTLTYTYTDGNGCTNSSKIEVLVTSPSTVNAGANDTVCANTPNYTLKNFSPAGGTWSGTGVSSAGVFSPSTAGPGTFTLTYTYGVGSCKVSATKIVKVNALPVVVAGTNEVICISQPTYTLAGYSPNGGSWSGKGVSTLGTFTPATAGAGIDTLTYSYTNPLTNCSNFSKKTIKVNPLPTVTTGPADTFCSSGGSVSLAGSPTGGTWKGKNVSSSGVFSPSAAGVGIFDLYYVYSDPITGCTDSAIHVVNVVNPSNVVAGQNDTVCINASNYRLTNYSPPGGVWSGTGIKVPDSFSAVKAGVGVFTLTYSVGKNTCKVTSNKTVKVNALPVVKAGTSDSVCQNLQAFTLSGYSPTGGTWIGTGITDKNKGIFNPKVAGVGSHLLTYIYTDPTTHCSNSDTIRIKVLPLPSVIMNNDTFQCKGVKANFFATSSNTVSYDWNFGDNSAGSGSSTTHVYNATGAFTVRLISTTKGGCSDTLFSKITISQPPIANFSRTPYSGPGPLSVAFTDLSSGSIDKYSWNYGNNDSSSKQSPGNESFLQSNNGDTTYYIILTVKNRCGISSHKDSVLVYSIPVANFGTDRDEHCTPFTVHFSNTSKGVPTSYFWNFGNGTTSTQQNPPPQVYTTDSTIKTYTITLVAKNKYGIDSIKHFITVLPNSVKAFFNVNDTEGCAPLSVQFTDYSRGRSTTFVSWDFGDGDTSSQTNPTHVYTKPGLYTAKEFVNDGCSYDTLGVQIDIHPKPPVNWKAIPTCVSDSEQFINLSTNFSGVKWDFGDGDTSRLVSPKHAYSKVGEYWVTLTIQSLTYGCPSSYSDSVQVDSLPKANFKATPQSGCYPLHVQFTNTGSTNNSYAWDFDDGNTSALENPDHTFPDSGIYLVKFSIITPVGCTNQVKKVVRVYPYPVAKFSMVPDPICGVPKSVQYHNHSIGAVGYTWYFSNGKSTTNDSPSIMYDTMGTYSAKLVAVNSFGCKDSTTHSFQIYVQPVAGFTQQLAGCQAASVYFKNTSTDMNSFLWNFGDTTIDSLNASPSHIYKHPGAYTVTLNIVGNGGCTDEIAKTSAVTVEPKPIAAFNYLAGNNPPTGWVDFNADTTGVVNYAWNFGDGDSTIGPVSNPRHRYDEPGTYTVKLIVTNKFDCADTIIHTVTVSYFEGLFVPNALAPNSGPPEERIFLPKGASLQSYTLSIYTTWGELLWENSDLVNGHPATGWDGTSNGKPLAEGVYVWKISATFINGQVWKGKEYNGEVKPLGTITLVR